MLSFGFSHRVLSIGVGIGLCRDLICSLKGFRGIGIGEIGWRRFFDYSKRMATSSMRSQVCRLRKVFAANLWTNNSGKHYRIWMDLSILEFERLLCGLTPCILDFAPGSWHSSQCHHFHFRTTTHPKNDARTNQAIEWPAAVGIPDHRRIRTNPPASCLDGMLLEMDFERALAAVPTATQCAQIRFAGHSGRSSRRLPVGIPPLVLSPARCPHQAGAPHCPIRTWQCWCQRGWR